MNRIVCMVLGGHRWQPDPDSKETYPVVICERCGRRRELSQDLVKGTDGSRLGRPGQR